MAKGWTNCAEMSRTETSSSMPLVFLLGTNLVRESDYGASVLDGTNLVLSYNNEIV